MLAVSELEKLRRDVAELSHVIDINLRPGSKSSVTEKDRRSVKAEIDRCIQVLDELRDKLSG
jgi:hypothetical protein